MAKLPETITFSRDVTAVAEFKAFLRRHPEIRVRSRTDEVVYDVQEHLRRVGQQFIGHEQLGADVVYRFKLMMQQVLDTMQLERRIENFRINETTTPLDDRPSFEIVIQPSRSIEYIVVDAIISP